MSEKFSLDSGDFVFKILFLFATSSLDVGRLTCSERRISLV
jgi:hypothetical protein